MRDKEALICRHFRNIHKEKPSVNTQRLRRGQKTILASALVFGLAASPAFGALVLLDNTAQGTTTLANTSSDIGSGFRKGIVFSVADDVDLGSVTFGLRAAGFEGDSTGKIALYAVDGSLNPTGSPISSVTTPTFSLTADPNDFTVSLVGMSVPAGDNYALMFEEFTNSGTAWAYVDPDNAPTAATGVTVAGYRFFNRISWRGMSVNSSLNPQGLSTRVRRIISC